MQRRIIDLTTPISTNHFRWPVKRTTLKSHGKGDISEVTWMGWPVHGFTHMDAGRHFSPTAFTTDDIELEQTIGEAAVVDVSDVSPDSPITEQHISVSGNHIKDQDIILVRTGWDKVESIDAPEFWTRAPFMTTEACRWIYSKNIKAIAFDFPQDRCIRDLVTGDRTPAFEENTTHIELLLKGVVMFEYLRNMTEIKSDRTEFFGLPLKIPHCDGAPARAIALDQF